MLFLGGQKYCLVIFGDTFLVGTERNVSLFDFLITALFDDDDDDDDDVLFLVFVDAVNALCLRST